MRSPARAGSEATLRLYRSRLDQQVHHQHLYRLVALVERRGPALDETLPRAAVRPPHLEHLGLHVQLVARPDRPPPLQLVRAPADDAAGGAEAALDEKTHGKRGGMPSARRQAAEERVAGSGFVEMERLRIELGGEGLDRGCVQPKRFRHELLSGSEFLEPDHDRCSSARIQKPCVSRRMAALSSSSFTARASASAPTIPVSSATRALESAAGASS